MVYIMRLVLLVVNWSWIDVGERCSTWPVFGLKLHRENNIFDVKVVREIGDMQFLNMIEDHLAEVIIELRRRGYD